MFRALIWKEWRQLALVRWGGVALGVLLPIAFTAGAELAQRGLLPTGRLITYAPRDLMSELLPAALALGLWPLIGLMAAVQAFAGDRAAGTESFLLERPVPRNAVWRARLCASFGTVVVVMAATGALAATAATLTGAPLEIGGSRWVALSVVGLGLGLLAYVGGITAASVLSSPLGALLLGAVLGAIPALLAAQLATVFSYARIGGVFLGAVLPIFLVPAFVGASWLAFCRGEPAGRWRIVRAVSVLGASLAGVLALFVVLAPIVVRANARIGQHSVYPARSGNGAFVGPGNDHAGEGWIVNVATGAKEAFVPPPVREVAWSPDGSELAMLTWSGPLGAVVGERIDIRSAADGKVLRSIPVADDMGVMQLTWADKGLVAIVSRASSPRTRQLEVEILDPVTLAWRPTGFRSEGWSMRLVGPAEDNRVFASMLVDENTPVGSKSPRGSRLHPIDVAAARVGPALADSMGRPLTFAGWAGGVSPSGRFARVVNGEDDPNGNRIVDLGAGSDQPAASPPSWARWIPGDRLVWHDDLEHRTRLFLEKPGLPPKVLREWRDAQVGIVPSPDGRAVFVSVIPAGGAPATDANRRPPDAALFEGSASAGVSPEELVYVPDEDRFVSLGPPFSDRPNDQRYSRWAGPRTLARIAPGVVYFEDLDAPGTRRFVIGGPEDLE